MKSKTLWIIVGVILLIILIVALVLGVTFSQRWLGFQTYRGWHMFAPHMMGHWVWGVTPLGFLWAILIWLIPIALTILIIWGIVGLFRGSSSTPATPSSVNAPSPHTTCPQCGHEVQPDWKLCPYCGTNLKP